MAAREWQASVAPTAVSMVSAGDSDGDGNGFVNANANLPVDAFDGMQVDVITPDNLAEAHAPGLRDATLGDGGLTDGSGGIGITVGAIEIDALNGRTLLDVHARGCGGRHRGWSAQ